MKLFRVFDMTTFEDLTDCYAITSEGELSCIGYDLIQDRKNIFIEWIGNGKIAVGDGDWKSFKALRQNKI